MRKLIKAKAFYLDNTFDNDIKAIIVSNGIIDGYIRTNASLPSQYETLDLGNSLAYPGFIDTHTHSFEGGLYSNGTDLYNCRSIKDVLDKIKADLDKLEDSNTLFAWRLDENNLKEKRFPTVKELDDICGTNYLIVRRIDGHSCIVSSNARRQIRDLDDYKPDVCKGGANDRAVYWFHENVNDATVLNAYHRASDIAISGGFTAIHTMIGDAQQSISHYDLIAKNLSQFGIEYILYPQTFNIKAALEAGATRIGGCILADGSIGSHTAALTKPYADTNDTGLLFHEDDFWYQFIRKAHQNNLQVGVHCLGDRAIQQINNCYLRLARDDFKDLRHQLIHCEITPDHLIHQIKASNAVPVVQPAFDAYWGGAGGLYETRLGRPRSQQMNRYKTMLDNQIVITGGSDWYITELDAISGIKAAITHHNKDERLSPRRAIDIYTKNAAWLSHDEKRMGSLDIGKEANITALNTPINDDISSQNITVNAVIRKGEVLS